MTTNYVPPPSTLPPGSIVDTYLRDSGGEKQDRSVARQLEAIQHYCAQYKLKLRHIFKDVAKSGGCINRSMPHSESGVCRTPNPEHAAQ